MYCCYSFAPAVYCSYEPTIRPSTRISKELAPGNSNRSFRRSSRKGKRRGLKHGKGCHKVETCTQGDPDAQSDRRGPPTDRPPGKPPPWKGVFEGSSYERASYRHASQLASSRGTSGLSVNASPLEKIQLSVKTPSNQRHGSAAGSSQGPSSTHVVRSWRHKSGRRSGVNGYACGNSSPFPNLGRNLFPCGVFLRCTKSAGTMAQRDNRHLIRWLDQRAHAPSAHPSACPVRPTTPLGPDQVNVLSLSCVPF
jgi:hypothetical protein